MSASKYRESGQLRRVGAHAGVQTRNTLVGAKKLLPGLGGELGGFLKNLGLNLKFGELETEDIILMLILYLMYRESGEIELLIALGALLFL